MHALVAGRNCMCKDLSSYECLSSILGCLMWLQDDEAKKYLLENFVPLLEVRLLLRQSPISCGRCLLVTCIP